MVLSPCISNSNNSGSASSCPAPALPLDILELVIRQLALDCDMVSIGACCLANSHLVHMCRKHLFASVHLHQASPHGYEPHPLKQFRRQLDRRPMIANYVRALEVVTKLHAPAGQMGIGAGHRAFRHLRRVHTFKLAFETDDMFDYSEEDFMKLPEPFRYSLTSFARRNDIVDLCLRNLSNVPVTFLQEFRVLEVLHLGNVQVVDDREEVGGETLMLARRGSVDSDGHSSGSSSRSRSPQHRQYRKRPSHHVPIPLRSLSLLGCKPFVERYIIGEKDDPRRLFDLSSLEHLWLPTGWTGNMDTFCEILKMSDRISSLDTSGCYPAFRCTNTISLHLTSSSVQSLKVLEIAPTIEDIRTDPYVGLVGELEKLASRGGHNLEELTIYVNVETDSTCTTEPEPWNALDRVLSAENAFPHLRAVKLKISLTEFNKDYSTIKQDLEKIGEGFLWLKEHVNFEFGVKLYEI